MHLLNLTLKAGSGITHAIYGNFTSAKSHEILCVNTANQLVLMSPPENGATGMKYVSTSTHVFGTIRSIKTFRLTGGKKDYIVIGSDSGKISILSVTPEGTFETLHAETFGKTGCRRITPGQYVAVDPKGRAIMIGALEKQKLVYVMNRDASNRLTISSPLEAHRSHTIHFDLIGVDVGFDNPIFAALEVDYADCDADPSGEAYATVEKMLVFYELDLGLNHVTRRWSCVVPSSSHKLISVPGGADGPGGVLVCAADSIVYKHYLNDPTEDEIVVQLPTRVNESKKEDGMIIIASATHKQTNLFFILIQNELGDLFKISITMGDTAASQVDASASVSALTIRLFDTIPIANALCITRTGFLFVATESGNHQLFQFASLADEEAVKSTVQCSSHQASQKTCTFTPSSTLAHLASIESLENLSPLVDLVVSDLTQEGSPQLYTLVGKSEQSAIRILRYGLAVTEMAISELPGYPTNVWCIKQSHQDAFDKFIIVSFANATLVLSIGESVEEVSDSGLLCETATLEACLLSDDSVVQIHAGGMRHIPPFHASMASVVEWKAPGKKRIEHCSVNARQVVLSLAGGELVYFELEMQAGSAVGVLREIITKDIGFEIACVTLGAVPSSRVRFPFLAVAGWDHTVRILSVDPTELLRQKVTNALSAQASSLSINAVATSDGNTGLTLSIGLSNGVLQQSTLDSITGTLSAPSSRFLGSSPVSCCLLTLEGQTATLAISSRAWVAYRFQNHNQLHPLSYVPLTAAAAFCSEQCEEGMVTVTGNTLRILALEKIGETFNTTTLACRYTPRRLIASHGKLIVIESDHHASVPASASVAPTLLTDGHEDTRMSEGRSDGRSDGTAKEEEEAEVEPLTMVIKTDTVAPSGCWASLIRVVDPLSVTTTATLSLGPDEAALSLTACVFNDRGSEVFILVGVATRRHLHSPAHVDTRGSVHVYRFLADTSSLVLLHATEVEGLPGALVPFKGNVLIGCGTSLRLYQLGKRKLLKKCDNKHFPASIVSIRTSGDRIYVADARESIHLVQYSGEENSLVIFADDTVPRFVSAMEVLDFDTVAGGDKFGNIFVLRLPRSVSGSEVALANPSGNHMMWEAGSLNGAANKLTALAHFHVGEVITSMVRAQLVVGGAEAILYTGVLGTIGALLPLTSREDIDFYTHLEMYMRQESPSIVGRDHLQYRSAFIPVKGVTDGDLCNVYMSLSLEKQKSIAADLDRSPTEIITKLQDLRNRLL